MVGGDIIQTVQSIFERYLSCAKMNIHTVIKSLEIIILLVILNR